MNAQGRIFFDGAQLRATLFDGECERLIVTFDHRAEGKDSFDQPSRSGGFARDGWANLRLSTRANDWYCNADTAAFCDALRGLASGYATRRLIGYSMGGYGALRFATALQAQAVTVISPQWAVHPDLAPFDPRYHVEGAALDPRLHDLTPHADPALEGLMIVDPFLRRDMGHAARIAALFPRLRLIRLGFAGHPATRTVTAAQKGWTIRRAAISPDLDAAQIRAAHREGRGRAPSYWRRMVRQAATGHPALQAKARARLATLREAASGDA